MTRVRLNDLSKRVNDFAQHYNPNEYIDSGASVEYFRKMLDKAPEIVIEYLLQSAEEMLERS